MIPAAAAQIIQDLDEIPHGGGGLYHDSKSPDWPAYAIANLRSLYRAWDGDERFTEHKEFVEEFEGLMRQSNQT